jgi:hypothetical protein
MSSDGMPKVRGSSVLGFDADKLLEQHKMENTGFLLEMILSRNTAPFSISGLMRFYSRLMVTSQATNYP